MRARVLASVIGLSAVAGFAWLTFASPAAACSGGMLLSPGQTYETAAAAIFTGTAVRVEDPRSVLDSISSSMDPMAWTFVVDGVEKDNIGDRVTITTPRSDASCGFTFWLGSRYRVFAYQRDGQELNVTIGNGTDLIATLPNLPPVEGSFRAPFSLEWYIWIGAAVVAIGAARAWLVGRNPRPMGA